MSGAVTGSGGLPATIEPARVRDPRVRALLDALTDELATGGYAPDQSFGYSVEQLERAGVRLLGARVDGTLVGVGGLELTGQGVGELKRFYVAPAHRGRGVADTLLLALMEHAVTCGVRTLRLETGDRQTAAIRFYGRHGFTRIERFGPYVASETSVCLQRSLAGQADEPA